MNQAKPMCILSNILQNLWTKESQGGTGVKGSWIISFNHNSKLLVCKFVFTTAREQWQFLWPKMWKLIKAFFGSWISWGKREKRKTRWETSPIRNVKGASFPSCVPFPSLFSHEFHEPKKPKRSWSFMSSEQYTPTNLLYIVCKVTAVL